MDFDALGQPLCKGVWAADSVSSDYETWLPSDGRSVAKTGDKCMLGHQVTYTRRKQTSECFNGEKFERPITKKNCVCTEEDFDCEMGFARKVGDMECKLTPDYLAVMPIPDACKNDDYFFAQNYRKVVGDTCEDGWQPTKVAVPCPAGVKMSRGAMSMIGTIALIATAMGVATFLSKSDRMKGFFANYGFDSHNNVMYSTIGKNAPETGLESVGLRFDADFIEDDFADDAPQLMTYNAPSDRSTDEVNVLRRIETAAPSVPKLQAPPGGSGTDDAESLDLL